MKTKKLGAAAKFGARYGKSVKDNYLSIEKLKHVEWQCPSCMKKSVKRQSAGIWQCTKCGHKFTGKAYKPG